MSMTTTNDVLGSEWLEHHGKQVTLDGRIYKIRATMHEAIYPYRRYEVHAYAECIGGPEATAHDLKYCCRDLIRTYDEEFWPRVWKAVTKGKRA